MRTLLAVSLGVALLSVSTAPGCAEESTEPIATAPAPIQGGENDGADTAVVGIYNEPHGALCTGSLLAPNLVLTARHCVSDLTNEGGVDCGSTLGEGVYSASGFLVTTGQDMFESIYEDGDFTEVDEVLLLDDDHICGNDLAILILKNNIPPEKAYPLLPRVDTALADGEIYSAIGYGESSDGNSNSAGYRRRRDGLEVLCVEEGCDEKAGGYVKVSEWLGEEGICSGDSGGPAIDAAGRAIGVTSRGAQNCLYPVYGSVHKWGDWVRAAARYAAVQGEYEAAPWAEGAPSDPEWNSPVGGDCDQLGCALCQDDACTRACDDDFGCPDGYECTDQGGETRVCTEVAVDPTTSSNGSGGSGSGSGGSDGSGGSGGSDGGDDGCSVSASADPTNPVPWFVMVGLAALRLRRRSRDDGRVGPG